MPKVLSKKKRISDVIKWEVNPIFTRGSMTVTATTADIHLECGDLYTKATATKSEDGASFDCVCAETTTVYAGETRTVLILERGPAIVDVDNIGVSEENQTTAKTGLLTLGILAQSESPVKVYQET